MWAHAFQGADAAAGAYRVVGGRVEGAAFARVLGRRVRRERAVEWAR
jgi:hypothetical protein